MPDAKSAQTPVARGRIEYLRSVRIVFEHPQWMKGLLMLAVSMLIPVLSTPVLFGYMYEVTEHLHLRQPGPYPLFEFRRFAHYITRGIWCYLLMNMLVAILVPIVQVVFQGGFFASIAALQSRNNVAGLIVAVAVPAVLTAFFAFLLALSILLTPLYLRAGLTHDFAQTFNFRWVGDFVRRMWLEVLLVNLFQWLASLVLLPLGCVMFCYGMLLAAALLSISSGQLNWQLYELYLTRGGEPIPLRPVNVADAASVGAANVPGDAGSVDY